ncbi:MAG: ABC-F family ATP-binding cassette domain-containing protein [Lentisphaeria bacterium]
MIQFVNVEKAFGTQRVIISANFAIHDGERVGFVGPNGAGKSTLFEMLAGTVTPDKGDCSYGPNQRLGYVRQQLHAYSEDTTLLDYTENAVPELKTIQAELHKVEHALQDCSSEEQERLLKRLGNLQTEFEHFGGYELKNRAETILSGLGFEVEHFGNPFKTFSGGWQIRAELARILSSKPDILLLDEPTNYLDVPAVEWLKDYLNGFAGTLVLVSHDRYMLNSLTKITIEVMGGYVTRYPGNYAKYMTGRQARYDQLVAQKRNVDHKKEQLQRFINRFKGKATKAAQAQSKQKMLDRLEDIEIPNITMKGPKIVLPDPPRSGDEIFRLENACYSYDGKKDVFKHLDLRLERGERAVFVGLNGMGKTTLLRLIAGHLELNSGKLVVGHSVKMGYQSQDFSETMDPEMTVYDTARSQAVDKSEANIRSLLGGFGFHGEAIDKHVQVLSGGEKVRLGLVRLLLQPLNFLLLDEPTTHLDVYTREALEVALQSYKGTLMLVSHDVDFVKAVATTIFYMTPGKLTRYYGNYDYFRQKLTAENAESAAILDGKVKSMSAGTVIGKKAEKAQASETYQERKQRKRDEVQIRTEIGKLKRPYDKKVQATEARISVLEKEQKELYEVLGNAKPGTDFAAGNIRLAEIKKELDDLAWRWEEAASALEDLTKTCEERLALLDE